MKFFKQSQAPAASAFDLLRSAQQATRPLRAGEAAVVVEEASAEAVPEDHKGALHAAFQRYQAGQVGQAKQAITLALQKFTLKELLLAAVGFVQATSEGDDSQDSRWRRVDSVTRTRYLLVEKARELRQWLGFVADTGLVPPHGPNRPVEIDDFCHLLCERAERIAAVSKLRELQDQFPEAISWAIKQTGQMDEHSFYGSPGTCENLLEKLVSYPRALPLGSHDGASALLVANSVVSSFLEAVVERRMQIHCEQPRLMSALGPQHKVRYLETSVTSPDVVGSAWIMGPTVKFALDELRKVNVQVLWSSQEPTLLDSQTPRLLATFCDLCTSTLRAGLAAYGSLHSEYFSGVRGEVLADLANADSKIVVRPGGGVLCAMRLAEEYEDFQFLVKFGARYDPKRLDELMTQCPDFRMQALQLFLSDDALRPLFCAAARRHQVPEESLEILLAAHPELRFALDLQKVGSNASDAEWKNTLKHCGPAAAKAASSEGRSAARRDALSALAILAHAAQGSVPKDPALNDMACVGKAQRWCLRGKASTGTLGIKRPCPDGLPLGPEECLSELADCFQSLLLTLRADKREAALLVDTRELLLLVERRQGAALEMPRRLLAAAVLAEEASWQKILACSGEEARQCIQETAFACLLRGPDGKGDMALPGSASPDELCESHPELQPFSPALRHAVNLAAEGKLLKAC